MIFPVLGFTENKVADVLYNKALRKNILQDYLKVIVDLNGGYQLNRNTTKFKNLLLTALVNLKTSRTKSVTSLSAILVHHFSDDLNTVTVMPNSGNSLRSSLQMLILDALTPVPEAISVLLFKGLADYLALILSIFAGSFLYLVARNPVLEVHENNPPLPSVATSVAGFTIIFFIVRVQSV
jgi:hypothetical protein